MYYASDFSGLWCGAFGFAIGSRQGREQGAIGRADNLAVENFPKIGDKRAVRISQHEFENSGTDTACVFVVEALVFLVAFVSSTKALVELFFTFKQGVNFIGGFLPRQDQHVSSLASEA